MRALQEITERIEFIRKNTGLNKSRFSRELGMKPRNYYNITRSRGRKLSVHLILWVIYRFGVNPSWLLSGKGETFTRGQPEAEEAEDIPSSLPFSLEHIFRILEFSEDAIISVTESQTIVFFNRGAEALFGCSQSELLGEPLDRLIPESHIRAHQQQFQRFLEGTIPSRLMAERSEVSGKRKDGAIFPAEASISKFEHEGQQILTIILRDITIRKQLEEKAMSLEKQMLQAQKMETLGVLAGGIAHDFNNFLTGIIGYAAIATSHLPADSPALSSIQMIESFAARASDFCRELLAYSGKARFVIEPVDLNGLIIEMGQLLGIGLARRARLTYTLAPALPPVNADATQIRQVIMNLITNAADAIGDREGEIVIATGATTWTRDKLRCFIADDDPPEGIYVTIDVSDTGGGMNDHTMAKIFDPFFTTKSTGRGLGLAALLGIVRAHHGAIKVSSEIGKGTTFRVLLPAAEITIGDSPQQVSCAGPEF